MDSVRLKEKDLIGRTGFCKWPLSAELFLFLADDEICIFLDPKSHVPLSFSTPLTCLTTKSHAFKPYGWLVSTSSALNQLENRCTRALTAFQRMKVRGRNTFRDPISHLFRRFESSADTLCWTLN